MIHFEFYDSHTSSLQFDGSYENSLPISVSKLLNHMFLEQLRRTFVIKMNPFLNGIIKLVLRNCHGSRNCLLSNLYRIKSYFVSFEINSRP